MYVAASCGVAQRTSIYIEPDSHWALDASYNEAKTDWEVAMNCFWKPFKVAWVPFNKLVFQRANLRFRK